MFTKRFLTIALVIILAFALAIPAHALAAAPVQNDAPSTGSACSDLSWQSPFADFWSCFMWILSTLPGTPPEGFQSEPTKVPALTAEPIATELPAATEAPADVSGDAAEFVSLNYDESDGDPLTAGQSQLVATYLRLAAPITQADLETAISKIQQEAANSNATVQEGSTLTLAQRVAWLVWCSDCTNVDPPADASLVHEISLLDPATLGRVWIQVPFAEGVPLRSDDTWTGGEFWAVAVH